jgi:hypothetical protein
MRRTAKKVTQSLARRIHPRLSSMLGKYYWSVIIPYVTVGQTVWHPTDPNFAPLSRGAFKTAKLARAWAKKHLGEHARYGVKKFEGG